MRHQAHRLGAVFYALWGILHILGGSAILMTYLADGGTAALAMFGTALAPAELPTATNTVVDGLVAYHSFNIMWFGIVVTFVAIRLNWQNSLTGYWINLVLVSLADLGLFFSQVFPGRISLGDAMVGAVLWIPALIFSTIAIMSRPSSPLSATDTVSQAMQGV